ncbi:MULTISPECIES: LCP family protein [Streptomyces]|uniref:LCP family protein required for cell wall assembly n=2 Tax=Streptomyces TaxID=1883 RepID=A0ABT9LEN8_STRGD|nr:MULTISPECIES: LCP family protein [Streptomyces]MDP9682180.1 LCP family protein required for cell wall assembly [Streptomyces griseoviridis]GGS83391.1 transcriptional regulator [Streptomyces griseoviridis]GGU67403.1 transcriptional regulator [Streptomyces daghestanicus]GHI33816.1 transcriptional regulator [Streptomyces daghestanicus]
MTDTAGGPGDRKGVLGPGAGASATGRGLRRRRRRRWLGGSALAGVAVLAGAGGVGWTVYTKLNGNITPDEAAAAELSRYEKERPTALVRGAQNILLIGSDSRSGEDNSRYGRDPGTERSDTAMLLHLSAGRHSVTAVSLPRDLMVEVPGCRRPDGSRSQPAFAQFNYAFEVGGSACSVRTVEKLTHIRIDHHVVVDFHGFKEMVDAVDGVEVCLARPVDDKAARLRLPAGRVTLSGEQALGYVRARKSLGDGSDTERMERQQRFLGALVNKVQSNRVLLNPVKLYPVLNAATSALTTDPDLANLRGLYALVRGLRDIPTERVQFLTVPRESWDQNANRDQLVEPAARKLFTRLRKDEPVTVAESASRPFGGDDGTGGSGTGGHDYRAYGNDHVPSAGKRGDEPADDAVPTPTFRGNTAAEERCE